MSMWWCKRHTLLTNEQEYSSVDVTKAQLTEAADPGKSAAQLCPQASCPYTFATHSRIFITCDSQRRSLPGGMPSGLQSQARQRRNAALTCSWQRTGGCGRQPRATANIFLIFLCFHRIRSAQVEVSKVARSLATVEPGKDKSWELFLGTQTHSECGGDAHLVAG